MSLVLVAAVVALMAASPAWAQLRIVDYNTANGDVVTSPRAGMQTILDAIGQEIVQGNARPLDILILQEQFGPTPTASQIAALLNHGGSGPYVYSTLSPQTLGSGRVGVVYNSATVQLINATALASVVVSTSGAARQPARYQFRPVGYTSAADFYIYNSHYKAEDDSDSANRRNVEATLIRANSDALGQGASVIYAGDFNMYSANEAAYQKLISAGNGQAVDPLGNNFASAVVHTQSPFNPATAGNNDLVSGGMDNRFDFQLSTAEVQDGEGLDLITGSYHAFGNNGTSYNKPINVTNTWSNPGISNTAAVLNALATVSDHAPVAADYQLPAKLAGSATMSATRMIVGGSANVNVAVYNDAPVSNANAADELDYQISGSGAVSGTLSGSDPAAGVQATGNLTFHAGNTPGNVSGQVSFSTTSPQVPVTSFNQNFSAEVVGHSNASFSIFGVADYQELDFGIVQQNAAVSPIQFYVSNVSDSVFDIAGLDIDAIIAAPSGPVNPFTWLLSEGQQIAPNDLAFTNVSFDTSVAGLFSTTFTVFTSDEDLPGSALGRTLTLHVTGEVMGVPEPASLALVTLIAPLLVLRRGRGVRAIG
jgi:endonuclease/exonuclease/phosphatase family metal-dependent hydrolase